MIGRIDDDLAFSVQFLLLGLDIFLLEHVRHRLRVVPLAAAGEKRHDVYVAMLSGGKSQVLLDRVELIELGAIIVLVAKELLLTVADLAMARV